MRDEVFGQYQSESGNWLKRGRMALLAALIDEAGHPPDIDLLEVGAGVGQNVTVLRKFGRVDVAEINPVGLGILQANEHIDHIYQEPIPFELTKSYDVICALDVIEHIADDREAVSWIADGLKPGGSFIGMVPAFQWLFSEHDVALSHYRRYSKRSFNDLLPADLEVVKTGYFNSILFPLPVATRLGKRLRRGRPSMSASSDVVEADASGGEVTDHRKETSDVPAGLDPILGAILSAETALIRRRPLFPFGLSVFTLARKRR